MFRKFVYESFTTVYTVPTTQGYASCGSTGASSSIAWTDNTNVAEYATYQNYTSWMGSYSAGNADTPCVTSSQCTYTTDSSGYLVIPWFSPNSASTSLSQNKAGCVQAAVMATSDILYALSYIASCEYIKTFALLTAVESSGACFGLGDGLLYLIMSQGLIGVGFFIVTVVGIMGYRRWQYDNRDDVKPKPGKEDEDIYNDSGIDRNMEAPQNDDTTSVPMVYNPSAAGGGVKTEQAASVGVPPVQARDKWV
jgi:hypothetical protein